MVVYDAKYRGLNAFQRENAMQGLPINFQNISAQPIEVTLGGTGYGTGQTTVEGARDYLSNIPSGITGQGPKFTSAQIDQALKGITENLGRGQFATSADATADLQRRMDPANFQEDVDFFGLNANPLNQAAPTATDPFTALMNMLSGGGMNLGGSNITGTMPSSIVGSGGSVPINAPTAGTIQPRQTNFSLDPNGLRVTVPGKPAIRIPINTAGAGGTGIYRDAIAAALRNAGVQEADIQTVLADYALTSWGQNENAPTAPADDVTASLSSFFELMGLGGATGANGGVLDPVSIAGMFDPTALAGTADGVIPAPAADGAATTDTLDTFKSRLAEQFGLTEAQMMEFFTQSSGASEGKGTTSTFSEADIQEFAASLYAEPSQQKAVELFGSMFNNADTDFDMEDLITGAGGVDELLGHLGLPVDLAELKKIIVDPTATAVAFETLGATKLNAFKELVRQSETTRTFNEAMNQFNQSLEVTKAGQQITILEKMMDTTMKTMELNQTAETNLMNAQIAAMNTALKSKELSQAEAASIRTNLLDAVGLELQEKRINNEQANFLSTQLLSQADLALRVRELDQRGESAAADRELEREGMALTERLGMADIADRFLGRQSELQFGREGLAQERELGFAGIDQRREEAAMGAQVALLNAAMQNPYSFAALNTLGGIPGMAGGAAPAAAAVSPTGMFPSLAGLGFQVPETAQAGTRTPAPAFFSGGMPTVGALGELDPASLAFLQNVLAFSGTPPEGLGRMAGAVTPAAGGYQGLGRTFFG